MVASVLTSVPDPVFQVVMGLVKGVQCSTDTASCRKLYAAGTWFHTESLKVNSQSFYQNEEFL
jgi:hypothetical protein